ncbi:GHKL domain-containing protein [Peptacetobacter hiranonis]|uniref:sensor histidine kinase n=1 Tax=Peptacetobacter hiranonis TaxID=89152 RepID=UPI002E79792E|nr:GHKL domain-containing protein [Peptacetobacter hiranonis]MEE0247919.1 GHKL domain-containing protein [Peptacetobacter hiranonis]
MSDVLLAEIIRLASIVLSIGIVNFVVGYRKNCDIDKWKNMAIQSAIVITIFIISKYIDVMNLSIIYNEKTNYIENYFSLFSIIKNFDFSIINLIWITVNIVIIVSMTLIYNKIYKVEWNKFIFLYILSGQYTSIFADIIIPRILFAIQTGKSLSDNIVHNLNIHDWNIFNIEVLANLFLVCILIIIFIKIINKILKNKIYVYASYIILVNSVFIMLKILVRFAEMHGPFQIEQYLIIMEVVPQLAIIAITVTIYIVIEMKKENEERIKEKQAYNRLETKNDYYEKVEESQNQIRRLYHDMNNHLYNIQMMNKSSEDASDYIVSLQNELKEARKTRVSGNSLFDIIVDEKMNICKNKGIEFDIDVDSKNTGFIKNMDMSSILANILDNAIEACDKMTSNKKYIKLTSMWADDMFIIICENSKENEVKKIGDRFITDKLNKSEHGIGIKSVEKSVKNYDGNMMIFCDDNLFKVKIMIPKR